MKTKVTTLVKSAFVQHNSEVQSRPREKLAIEYFGKSSAVAQLVAAKGFSDPSQEDYAAIAASQQFISLVKEKSIIGQIEELGKHKAMPLNTLLSSFDLSPCEVVPQAAPVNILRESSDIGFTLDFKKIGGYAIFPDRYFSWPSFAKVESLINEALLQSYVAGENADFIETITADATTVTATGSTMPGLLGDITEALDGIEDPQSVIILLNPKTALTIANDLELTDLGVNGGNLRGIPVITNVAVPETRKIIFDATKLVIAADPSVEIKATTESAVKGMTGDDVYLFQENKIALQIMGINGYKFMTSHTAIVIEG